MLYAQGYVPSRRCRRARSRVELVSASTACNRWPASALEHGCGGGAADIHSLLASEPSSGGSRKQRLLGSVFLPGARMRAWRPPELPVGPQLG